MMSHQVFISYSNPDKAIADEICHALEDKGIMCWIAPRDVRPGERFALEIIHGIKNCKVMVLVFTKDASESEHVANEIDRAFNLHKTIIPFLVEDTPMNEEYSYYLSRKHWLVAYPNYREKLGSLAETICDMLNIPVNQSNNHLSLTINESVFEVKTHYLKLKTNLDCVLYIDGEEQTRLWANKRLKISLEQGEYELKLVSADYPELMKEIRYDMPNKDKLLDVDFQLELIQERQEKKEMGSEFNIEKADLLINSEEPEAALNYVLPYVLRGDALAQFYLGMMYLEGEGVKEDFLEAFNLISLSAKQGNEYGQYALGMMYGSDEYGVEKNLEEAFKWCRKAAEQGCAEAQNAIGDMYYDGDVVKQDYAEAVSWYRKAVEQGDAEAQYNLGWMYQNGYGVKKNIKEALEWYKKAAEQGYEDAKKKVAELS